jgi:phosphatidylglycerol:prolipoprotein diacylglycerol transferase
MHPTLLEIPISFFGRNLAVHSYGFFIAVGFVAGVWLSMREARKIGDDPERILDASFWLLVAGLLGSRVVFILVNWEDYLRDPLAIVRVWEGGLVWYGGFLGAVLAAIYYVRRYRMSYWRMADIIIPSVPLGHAFGRLGCFSAGCCWGRECAADFSLGVRFTHVDSLAPRNVPIHPVQLYEAFGETLIFFALVLTRSRKRFDGQVMLMHMTLYPILRSIVEVYRGDKERGFLIPGVLSTSQFISALVLVGAVMAQVVLVRRARAREAGGAAA